jgi:hypothetical protein
MHNKLATLEPLISSIKQHPVRWAIGSLAVKGVPTAAVVYEVRKKKKNKDQKEGSIISINNQFFIRGIETSLKEAGFFREVGKGLKEYFRLPTRSELKDMKNELKTKPGRILGTLAVPVTIAIPTGYGIYRILKHYKNRKKMKQALKEAGFFSDFAEAYKDTFKLLVSKSAYKNLLQRIKQNPGYEIGRLAPGIILPAIPPTIYGLSKLIKRYKQSKLSKNP